MTTHEQLQRAMDFDHPIVVNEDGTITDAVEVYAPAVHHVEGAQHPHDVEIDSDQWVTWSVGYTGQHSYNGAVMHSSEFIGGRLADDLLAEPGTYVVCAVEVYPADNPWSALDPAAHCFREDNCRDHPSHAGSTCCCCGYLAGSHSGCDCDETPAGWTILQLR